MRPPPPRSHGAAEERREVVALVERFILATDMGRHPAYMAAMQDQLDAAAAAAAADDDDDGVPGSGGGAHAPSADAGEGGGAHAADGGSNAAGAAERRALWGELLVKCADTSNVLKPFPVARRWAVGPRAAGRAGPGMPDHAVTGRGNDSEQAMLWPGHAPGPGTPSGSGSHARPPVHVQLPHEAFVL